MKIAFFSSSSFALPILQNIHDNKGRLLSEVVKDQLEFLSSKKQYRSNFGLESLNFDNSGIIELVIVVSQPDDVNRSKVTSNPITDFAMQNNINIINPGSFNESRSELFDSLNIDMGITASYGQYINTSSLNSTNYGFVNWHPSLLPLYRGATPMQMTLVNGDELGGLSWIDMTSRMDEGDVYLQLSKVIDGSDNFSTLSKELGILGANTWAIALINKLINHSQHQDNSKMTLCSKLSKENKYIDLAISNSTQVFNQFRAYIEFPFTVIGDDSYFGQDIKLLECQVFVGEYDQCQEYGNWRVFKNNKKQVVLLRCADETFLQIQKIQLANGKRIDFGGYQF